MNIQSNGQGDNGELVWVFEYAALSSSQEVYSMSQPSDCCTCNIPALLPLTTGRQLLSLEKENSAQQQTVDTQTRRVFIQM